MASILRRWVRALCEECGETVSFEVRPDWSLVCPECRSELQLEPNGLYPRPRPATTPAPAPGRAA
ncbi:MAG: hypothetical protein HMLKMBBP_01584 [Planctomycetes bacterium]|nr:hypothetical protein [Planctomycetota bacterium]